MGKKTGRANGSAGPAAGPASAQTGTGTTGSARRGPETITLPSGEQVPVAPPPGIDPAMYEQALAYLRQNPEAALQAQEQMRRMGSPAMAQAASRQMQDPEYRKKMEELREDPELKPMFDDIAATGSAGMDRYWNDADLMSRISHKMQQMGIQPPQPPPQPSAPSKSIPNLHDAAKAGDEDTVARLLDEGSDVDGRDARGITPLGVAVGFNKLPVVKALVAGGANVALTDARGNTPLHYAAGYGRKEAAGMLLAAGAIATATNGDGQTPSQVAETNHEVFMVEYLATRLKGSKDGKVLSSAPEEPQTPEQTEPTDADKYL